MFKSNQRTLNLRKLCNNFLEKQKNTVFKKLKPKLKEKQGKYIKTKTKTNKNQKYKLKKIFKLSDFGLCTNIKKQTPKQFGSGVFLAPEICKKGPDSKKVVYL